MFKKRLQINYLLLVYKFRVSERDVDRITGSGAVPASSEAKQCFAGGGLFEAEQTFRVRDEQPRSYGPTYRDSAEPDAAGKDSVRVWIQPRARGHGK